MMALFTILSFLILGLGSYVFLQRCVLVNQKTAAPAAFATTLFLTSCLYFLALTLKFSFWLIPALSAVTGSTFLVFNQPGVLLKNRVSPVVTCIVCVAALILTLKFNHYVYRWGDWDAWAIWNLHAKFLFYPEHWTQYFTTKMIETHPDYPLMLPSLIAYFWRGLGFITPITPILIAWSVCLALPLTIFAGTYRNGNWAPGVVALFIFLADPKYISLSGSQYADTLVALFIVIVLIIYQQHNEKLSVFALLGFVAAATANIKNEGLLFFAVFSLLITFYHFKNPANVICYGIGAIIPLIFVVYLKTTLAPPNDIIDPNRGASVLSLLTDSSRYVLIIGKMAETLIISYWYLILMPIVMWWTGIRKLDSFPLWLFTLMALGYIFVYATTPHDLNWHLTQSADRVIHHLAPSMIYIMFSKIAETAYARTMAKD